MALTEVLQWRFVPYSYTKGLGSIRYLKSNVLYAVVKDLKSGQKRPAEQWHRRYRIEYSFMYKTTFLQVGGKIFIYSAWNLAQAELALVGLNIIFQKLWRELNPHI